MLMMRMLSLRGTGETPSPRGCRRNHHYNYNNNYYYYGYY